MQTKERMKAVSRKKRMDNAVTEKWPTGALKYTMTNDFLFKAVFQRNQGALEGLLCAMLGFKREEITSLRILNPVQDGMVIDDKAVILDLKLELNDNSIINIEMQVENEGDWEERSLTYLCRDFDQLKKGEDYRAVKKTIHIGILNFTPKGFPARFYTDYFFYHLNTEHRYSDKLAIYVLQLNQLGNEEDERNMPELYHWAQMFRATSWEELHMLAEKNEDVRKCVVEIKELTADERMRMECEAREDYYRRLSCAEKYGIEQGIEQGIDMGKAQMLVSSVENAMKNFDLSLEQTCAGLGATTEEYYKAKEICVQK